MPSTRYDVIQYPPLLLTSVLAVVLLLGCTELLGPRLPEGTVPLDPLPPEYEGWWGLVERCAGRQGNLSGVDWRILPEARTIPGTDGANGLYSERDHSIVLVENRERDGWLVRHEMLHALLRDGRHRRARFVEQCGGIVSCGDVCTREAGEPRVPDSTTPRADPQSMEIRVEVVPQTLSLSAGTRGCVTIVVSALNTVAAPVQVYIGDSGSLGFSWLVEEVGAGSGGPFGGDSEVAFEASGARRYAFDCPALTLTKLEPGQYRVRGIFAGAMSEPVRLTVVP